MATSARDEAWALEKKISDARSATFFESVTEKPQLFEEEIAIHILKKINQTLEEAAKTINHQIKRFEAEEITDDQAILLAEHYTRMADLIEDAIGDAELALKTVAPNSPPFKLLKQIANKYAKLSDQLIDFIEDLSLLPLISRDITEYQTRSS